MPSPFATEITVRFGHIDAAGIVFYPRYLEMVNETIERWFEECLGVSFRELHMERHAGTPTKHLAVDFLKPSRLGDRLTFTLRVAKIGRSSFDLEIVCSCGREARFKAAATLVYTSFEPFAPAPLPEELRLRMAPFVRAGA
ncbi:MAG: acyl-CoA thioesterase [Rhodospirillaceae bacterium]|nr:acyl-CoA thioesterase [Rhodospirillaceae bacterium]